jgi:L-arabinose 1- dehydrogenase
MQTCESLSGRKPVPEPYQGHIVPRELKCLKNPLDGYVVGVLGNAAERRGMMLIPMPSRVVRTGDVHELVSTTDAARPGDTVDAVGYLAWVAFDHPGVIVVGDVVHVDGSQLGEVCGFDETHAPNHLNIVIQTSHLLTGRTAHLEPNVRVTFTGRSRDALGW